MEVEISHRLGAIVLGALRGIWCNHSTLGLQPREPGFDSPGVEEKFVHFF